jgi:Peptidase family M1 domain
MLGMRFLPLLLVAALAAAGTPASAAAADPVDRTSYLLDASYVVHIDFDWPAGALDVTTDMQADNRSGGRISRLELNTLAARLGHMQLLEASVDGTAVTPTISDQTMIVRLPQVLGKHGHVSVHTRYRATLLNSVSGHDWLWSQKNGVAAVYRSIPWLSVRKSFERNNIGDPFVTPVASRVRVTFTSNSAAVRFATSGQQVVSDEPGTTFVAHNVRDFNFTASRKYVSLSGMTLDGQSRIHLLTQWAPTHQQKRMLSVAQRAIAQYESWVGQLPCPTITIAETDGGSAMESPCLIWIPRDQGSFIDYLVAHELAHQWFYGVVGNDQAADPFLDEAMTDFLSRSFLHQLRASRCAQTRLDRSIYQYTGCYYEVIYIQGSQFLDQLRQDMGSALFWRTLRTFWTNNRYTVSSTFKLLEAFRAAAGNWVLPRFRARFPSLYPSN